MKIIVGSLLIIGSLVGGFYLGFQVLTSADASNQIIGMLVAFAFLPFGVWIVARELRNQELERTGRKVIAEITKVEVEGEYNGQVLYCHWYDPQSGIDYTFKSDLSTGLSNLPRQGQVEVYLDPSNFKRYYVKI